MNDYTKESVVTIENLLNSFNFSASGVAKEMTKMHRTLQQNFTRLAVEWLRVCASDDYHYDGRNEDSHKVAKALLAHVEDLRLPFI